MPHKTTKAIRPLISRQQRVYNFLSRNKVGVLTSVDPEGEPHGSVIYYVTEPDCSVAFITKSETKKYGNLKNHSQVMLVVFEKRSQTVAQITGEAIEIEDSYRINKIAAAVAVTSLRTSDGGIPPIAKLYAGDYKAFIIKPIQIRIACYARAGTDFHENIFESIESFELNRGD